MFKIQVQVHIDKKQKKTSRVKVYDTSRVFLRKIYNCTIPPPFPPLPSFPFPPASPLPPFSGAPGISPPEKFLELEMLVGKF